MLQSTCSTSNKPNQSFKNKCIVHAFFSPNIFPSVLFSFLNKRKEQLRDKNACTVLHLLGPVQTMPEEFENRVLTLKKHQMFSVHTAPEEFMVDENSGMIIVRLSFSESFVYKFLFRPY